MVTSVNAISGQNKNINTHYIIISFLCDHYYNDHYNRILAANAGATNILELLVQHLGKDGVGSGRDILHSSSSIGGTITTASTDTSTSSSPSKHQHLHHNRLPTHTASHRSSPTLLPGFNYSGGGSPGSSPPKTKTSPNKLGTSPNKSSRVSPTKSPSPNKTSKINNITTTTTSSSSFNILCQDKSATTDVERVKLTICGSSSSSSSSSSAYK